MPTITINNLDNRKIFEHSSEKSALQIIHENQTDWMHSCGGKGKCTSCKMIIIDGMSNLSAPTEPEIKYKEQGRLGAKERLACQSHLNGDITIKVAQINKFPHITYSD
jgi:2Fe-2S ferredoxin